MFPKKLSQQAVSDHSGPIVGTRQGRLRGTCVDGTYIFRGVAYAQAKRFHLPEPPDTWGGVRDALSYGPVCSEISTLIPRDGFTVPHLWYPQSEHCQYLNLWTQHLDKEAKKPVMVWIHGGGFEHGSSIELFAYDGEELSRFGDVVVITLNHRVNALGFLDLSHCGRQYANSGNAGMADLVAALHWVRDNISAFGGDPDNVTLFGQSGGGGKISALLQMPSADGLFHKVSIQSGISDKAVDFKPEQARAFAGRILYHLGLTAETPSQIESVPFYKLATAINEAAAEYEAEHGDRFRWGPLTDGRYYVGHPGNVGFRSETTHIPMLIGNVLGEFENNAIDTEKYIYGHKSTWSEDVLQKRLRQRFGDGFATVRTAFEKAYPGRNPADALFLSTAMRLGHVRYGKLRAACASAPVYNWLLTLELPADGGSTPWHNADEPFVFHQAEYLESTFIPEVTDKLQDQVAGAWVAFAYTGNPNHAGLPDWTPLSADHTQTMIFDRECALRTDHDAALMDCMEALRLPDTGSKGPLRGYGGAPRITI